MSAGAPLADDDARRRIIGDLGSELAVDAAAGSGKTTVLVARVVSLVESKLVPMRSIAAITFTEAAAAELRTRLRKELAKAAEADPELGAAVHEVDEAAVSTIHAFARRILIEHWLAAGLPPRVDVLDAPAEQIEQRERWSEFTNELLADPSARVMLVRAFAAELRLSQLPELARALTAQHHRLDERVLGVLATERRRRTDPDIDLGPLIGALDAALAYRADCGDEADALLMHLRTKVYGARRRLGRLEPGDEASALSALADLPTLSCTRGRGPSWRCPVAEVRDRCADAQALAVGLLTTARESVLADLLFRMAEWVVRCARQRRDEGRLTFHDLLVESCRLLRRDDAVRHAVRARYRCLLVDEFQDTDPLQVELATLLSAAEAGDATGGPARLFAVGDPEQSIYRFRGADVALFMDTVNGLDARLELASNFRSVPGVLAWVDELFSRDGWDVGSTSGPAAAHRSLSPVREAPEGRDHPPVVLYGDPHVLAATEVRRIGAEETAALARRVVDEAWHIQPRDGDAPRRAARFADVAILIPTRTSLATLERALEEAGVPYRLEGDALVWAAQEVRDLLAVLRAADDPADAVAVVAALRTAALACGDDDLVRFRKTHQSWDPRGVSAEATGDLDPVSRAMTLLADLHELRMWLEPSAFVSGVLDRLHLFELALVHERPRDHWQRLRWVLDQARVFDEAIGGTLGDFLAWIDLRQEEGWSSSLGPPEPDDDAVRILTIHGAKGLEFPIVFLSGLEGFDHPRPPAKVLFDRDGIPQARIVVGFESSGYEAAAAIDKRLESEERRRLLYVAVTRARDYLFVDVTRKERANSLLMKLAGACGEFPAAWTRPAAPADPAPVAAARAELRVLGPDDGAAAQAEWVRRRQEAVAAGTRQEAWSATALARLEDAGGRTTAASVTSTRTGTGSPRPGASEPLEPPSGEEQRLIGRAVHDTLAKLELDRWAAGAQDDETWWAEVSRVAASATDAQGLEGGRSPQVARLVGHALGAPTVRAIARARHFRELPLQAPVALPGGRTGVVEGVADLVGQLDNGFVVVDFKTFVDRKTGSHATDPEHLRQVAAYAYALESATGQPVDRAVVCYLFDDGADEVSISGAALAATVDDVLADAGRAVLVASPSR
jgi:ATP-dependent exoDNAse (exonuclease V) beta subunit